mmetsp:Transcript_41821/g.121181  ORF Transcript_41821/g.121181 Transcript_41821/m.121181 type:complete len:444 (+) Transcript_41821:307-1638(+)
MVPLVQGGLAGEEAEGGAAAGEAGGPPAHHHELVIVLGRARGSANLHVLGVPVWKHNLPPAVLLPLRVEGQGGQPLPSQPPVVKAGNHAAAGGAHAEKCRAIEDLQHLLLLQHALQAGRRLQGPLLCVKVKHIAEPWPHVAASSARGLAAILVIAVVRILPAEDIGLASNTRATRAMTACGHVRQGKPLLQQRVVEHGRLEEAKRPRAPLRVVAAAPCEECQARALWAQGHRSAVHAWCEAPALLAALSLHLLLQLHRAPLPVKAPVLEPEPAHIARELVRQRPGPRHKGGHPEEQRRAVVRECRDPAAFAPVPRPCRQPAVQEAADAAELGPRGHGLGKQHPPAVQRPGGAEEVARLHGELHALCALGPAFGGGSRGDPLQQLHAHAQATLATGQDHAGGPQVEGGPSARHETMHEDPLPHRKARPLWLHGPPSPRKKGCPP